MYLKRSHKQAHHSIKGSNQSQGSTSQQKQHFSTNYGFSLCFKFLQISLWSIPLLFMGWFLPPASHRKTDICLLTEVKHLLRGWGLTCLVLDFLIMPDPSEKRGFYLGVATMDLQPMHWFSFSGWKMQRKFKNRVFFFFLKQPDLFCSEIQLYDDTQGTQQSRYTVLANISSFCTTRVCSPFCSIA